MIFFLLSGGFIKIAIATSLYMNQAKVCSDPAPHIAALHVSAADRGISTNRLVSDLSQLNNVLDIPSNTRSGKLQPAQTFSFPGQNQIPHYIPESGLQILDRWPRKLEYSIPSKVLTGHPAPSSVLPHALFEGSFQSKPVRRGCPGRKLLIGP